MALWFTLTHKFADFEVENDWLKTSKWFDVKLLVDSVLSDVDYCKLMINCTFLDVMKKVLRAFGWRSLSVHHWVHLGIRVLGPKRLELYWRRSQRTFLSW